MRAVALAGARAALLAGPTALAFFSGGYFDGPRAWAGLVVWVLVAIALIASPDPFPRYRGSWLAIVGLVALAAWTLLSLTWAPVAGVAYHAGQRVFVYAGALLAGTALLRGPGARRAVEPALAAGVVIVIGYGLSERLLPGLLHFSASVTAQGRLEQPLTYWNAMGELAALGSVLCARLMGDHSRPVWMRAVAAATVAPLGAGLYLSFSRGALFACLAGLVALLVVAPSRQQLRALLVALAAGGLGAAATAPFGGVTSLRGAMATRELQGAITLGLLVAIAVIAAVVLGRASHEESTPALRLPRRAPLIALVAICVGLTVAIIAGAKERSTRSIGADATRLATLQSDRYAYWRVALRAFGDEPVRGVGAGGWAVYWLRDRPFGGFADNPHSLPLQTAAELGLVGLALLAAFLAGIGFAARRALRLRPAMAAGPIAGLVTYLAHAPLDWDWQMPAVTGVALVLAGGLLGLAEQTGREPRSLASRAATPSDALDASRR